jgi:hypothetical protein
VSDEKVRGPRSAARGALLRSLLKDSGLPLGRGRKHSGGWGSLTFEDATSLQNLHSRTPALRVAAHCCDASHTFHTCS